MNTNAVRTVRKVGRPRPLRISAENIQNTPISPPILDPTIIKKNLSDSLNDLENLHIGISNGNYDENTVRDVAQIYNILKSRGSELDSSFKDQMDRYFVTLRNVSREERLDMASRLRLLEVIELRAMKWKSNENLEAYYKERILEIQSLQRTTTAAPIPPPIMPAIPFSKVESQVLQSNIPPLEPGEVLRSSGKFSKPAKVAGKNYFKDEIVIRNSDSGKVMGIKGRRVHMIEELSDTIISFQRVTPGARDRLVQITGPHEEAIGHAKLLVEDTIRRNASPIREKRDQLDMDDENENLNCFNNQNYYEDSGIENFAFRNPLSHSLSMSNATMGKYMFNIPVGDSFIEISGENSDLIKEAKLVLEEYFSGQAEIEKVKGHSVIVSLQKDHSRQVSFSGSSYSSGNFLTSDTTRVNHKHEPLRQSNSLSSELDDKCGSPFYSSSEDEIFKPTPPLAHAPTVPTSIENPQLPMVLSPKDCGDGMPIRYSCGKITYSREFLLKCSKLKYSHLEPRGFPKIAKEFPMICKEPSHMFDPEEFKEQVELQILENSNEMEK